MTEVTAVKCLKCGDTVFSRARHDMRGCSCESVFIDGGFDYTKVSFVGKEPPKPFQLEVEQTREELYQDWNETTDKYGLILKG